MIRYALPLQGAVLLVLGLALTACGALPGRPAATASATYVLQWSPNNNAGEATRSPPCGTLLVSAPRAAPGFDTARMAYVRRDYRLDYFVRNRWADSPARMLRPAIVAAMSHSALFRNVLGEVGQVPANLRLDSEVLRLQQVFSAGHSEEQFTVRMELIDTRRSRVLLQRVFNVSERAASNDPYGGVVAANRALQRLMVELTSSVGSVLAARSQACATSKN